MKSQSSKTIELDMFTKWCNRWAVRLEELFYYVPYRELGDNITFADLKEDRSEVETAFNELKQLLQAHFEALVPEKLTQSKEEENSDWFYGYGYNLAIDEMLSNIRGEKDNG